MRPCSTREHDVYTNGDVLQRVIHVVVDALNHLFLLIHHGRHLLEHCRELPDHLLDALHALLALDMKALLEAATAGSTVRGTSKLRVVISDRLVRCGGSSGILRTPCILVRKH